MTIATAATATGLATAAQAAVLSTSITSPAPYEVVDADFGLVLGGDAPAEPQTMRVTGTATTDGSDPNEVRVGAVIRLDLLRTFLPIGFSEPIAVAADGGFAADIPVPPINAQVIALPEDLGEHTDFEDVIFDGDDRFPSVPVLGGGSMLAEAPGLGRLSLAIRGQRQGFAAIGSAGFASLEGMPFTFGALGGVTSGAFGDTPGDFGLSFMGTAGISDQYNDARGGVMVDGARGYLRDHIPVGGDELPLPTVERTVERGTGGQTVVQTQPVYVAVDASDDPDGGVLPGGYRASGLELQRTTIQGRHGRQVSVTDRFRSTDGRAHRIDLLYAEGMNLLPYNARTLIDTCLPILPCSGDSDGPFSAPFSPLSGDGPPLDEPVPPSFPAFDPPAFRIPWETGTAWERRSHAEPLTAPAAAISTLYTRLPNVSRLIGALFSYGEGGPSAPITSTYGAITFGTRPDAGLFVSDPYTIGAVLGGVSTQFVARFVRDVPAGGQTTISQVYSTGETTAQVEALAAAAERNLTPLAPPMPPAPPAPPLAPPTPPAPPAARKAPRKLTTSSSLKRTKSGRYRYRLRFSGRLALPSGVAKSACRAGGGTVTVQVKAGRNTISTRRVKLNRNCRYAVRINFRSAKRFGKRKRLTVVTKWSGNRTLAAKPAKRFTVRVR